MPMGLSADEARNLFSYDKETGDLRWKVRLGQNRPIGSLAGSINGQGYREVMVRRKTYQVSRIIWLIVTGREPHGQIDHIDMNRSNNKWNNLRDATLSQNRANCRARPNNKTKLKGAYRKKNGRYYPFIQIDGKPTYLGGYATAEEAHKVWIEAAKKYRGEFARW